MKMARMAPLADRGDPVGVAIALAILAAWFTSLAVLFCIDVAQTPKLLVGLAVLGRSFLHTGLFITAHDAIHGVLSQRRWLNDGLGRGALLLYALLPYDRLAKTHWQHHRAPATADDPDYCVAYPGWFLPWYGQFMAKYQAGRQGWITFWGLSAVFYPLIYLGIDPINLALFWLLPMLLSSLQLFTFGIFLPHRRPAAGYSDDLRTNDNTFPVLVSFLTCYHFGYHRAHHQRPDLPWYRLPEAHRERLAGGEGAIAGV